MPVFPSFKLLSENHMRRLYTLIWLFLLAVSMPLVEALADSGNEKLLLEKAQELLKDYKDTEALQVYEQVLAISPQNFEALCKASFLHNRMGDRYQDETQKTEHFEKAKTYAMQAYGLRPHDAEANYVMAMSVGNLAMVSGPRKRLEGINQAKIFVDEALKSNSEHSGAWHLLGRWHFKMANLNLAEVTAAKIIFGGVTEEASNLKAIEAIQKAIQYNPENLRYYYDLATIYKELDKSAAYISTLEQALALQVTTSEDLEVARRCKMLLAKEIR